jgi:hypothetical protein
MSAQRTSVESKAPSTASTVRIRGETDEKMEEKIEEIFVKTGRLTFGGITGRRMGI